MDQMAEMHKIAHEVSHYTDTPDQAFAVKDDNGQPLNMAVENGNLSGGTLEKVLAFREAQANAKIVDDAERGKVAQYMEERGMTIPETLLAEARPASDELVHMNVRTDLARVFALCQSVAGNTDTAYRTVRRISSAFPAIPPMDRWRDEFVPEVVAETMRLLGDDRWLTEMVGSLLPATSLNWSEERAYGLVTSVAVVQSIIRCSTTEPLDSPVVTDDTVLALQDRIAALEMEADEHAVLMGKVQECKSINEVRDLFGITPPPKKKPFEDYDPDKARE